jgi:hypothetical protein
MQRFETDEQLVSYLESGNFTLPGRTFESLLTAEDKKMLRDLKIKY